MADQCIFFDELLRLAGGRHRIYEVSEPAGLGLACVEASLRQGDDWWFARRWIRTGAGPRELYRTLDRLEACGFRFQVLPRRAPSPLRQELEAAGEQLRSLKVRASELRAELTPEEQGIHDEVFPEESRLLGSGYDWDMDHVYRNGVPLARDGFGRVLESQDGVLYEWVSIRNEVTWRRYPLERLRLSVTAPGR